VLFAPGRNADAVADFTLGLILSVTRGIGPTHHLLKMRELTEEAAPGAEGRADVIWTYSDRTRPHPYALYKGPELRGMVLGLVGFGDVGRRVAERAVALRLRVLVHDPYVPADRIAAAGCNAASLDDLLREADIVSLHARGTGRPLLGERELHTMKQGSYLINTARATLLDYDALYRALRDKHLAGAGLDVYPIEPLPPDSPLLTLDNVTLTPHLAGASTDVVTHQSEIIVDNIMSLLAGQSEHLAIKNPAVLDDWYARRG
jgi:D-3-phosphoglycerate dehydrogenase